MKINKVSILGAGSWGTTVATLVSKNMPAWLWARDPQVALEINASHRNSKYLQTKLPCTKRLVATNDLQEALRDADVILVGVPTQGFRAVLSNSKEYIQRKIPIISLAKGLEQGTSKRMTEVIAEVLPGCPTGVLTGPNLASEIITGRAAASVLAMQDQELSKEIAQVFQTSRFRVYTNTDVIGCEISGALKNVIAIACGMADGIDAGDNTRSAFITRGLAEITRLGVAMGGKLESFAGLAGLGDLIATCTSNTSRNHYVGEQLGKGHSLTEITASMHMVAEGVNTAKTMLELGQKYGVDLPIAAQVDSVLSGATKVYHAFFEYLKLQPGSEGEPG